MRDFSLQFFLKVGDLLITLPVNPEELEISKGIGYDTYSNLDKKEILKLQEDKLIELEIESILEKTVSSLSVTDTPWTPDQYLNTFNGWKDNRTIVRVTSSDGQLDFEGYIVDVTTGYEGGTDDYNYTLTIVQERSVQLLTNIDNNYSKIDIEYQVLRYTPQTNPTVQTDTNSGTSNTSNSSNAESVTYTVKKGDTLSSIARAYYGDSSKWKDIYNANKDKIKNANLIYVGQVLTIPNSTKTVTSAKSTTSTKSTTSKSKSTSTTKTTDTSTTKTSKSGETTIQGVTHWGASKIFELEKKLTDGHSYATYFYPDSGTYIQYNTVGGKQTVVKTGYINSYVPYTAQGKIDIQQYTGFKPTNNPSDGRTATSSRSLLEIMLFPDKMI